jgi:hypothetical protein
MLHDLRLSGEFFAMLEQADQQLACLVREKGCPYCNGALHVGNYPRKPRGASFAATAEAFGLRHSLCCGREGCRKRVLPPSLRFLGRRVYVEVVVLLASVMVLLLGATRTVSRITKVPGMTLKRWGTWWREEFPKSQAWMEISARMVPTPEIGRLPRSFYEGLEEALSRERRKRTEGDACVVAARLLAPCTTGSLPDASGFMRGLREGWMGERFTQKM